ncbi:uncharacterized protein A4U43_C03F18170 [Asparagus officinalis]|uniref:Late embryogenesis abundant protein LEA-2 subgroup domain-containing protein n=1 Tax=Asparagus officinalis TaxID=4686 RepID=A0A5P1FG70_ASPOF|nr:uncharacterized protein A4U43_C03F18170 [Asparagus officinalis]
MSYDFKLTSSIQNPNKRMDVDYAGVETTVTYGIHTIAATNERRKFFQDADGTVSKEVRVVETDHDVSSRAVKAIEDDVARNHGEVKFGVKMEAYLRFGGIHWLPRYYGVYRPDVKFQFVNGTARGEMVGPAVTCNSVEDWR